MSMRVRNGMPEEGFDAGVRKLESDEVRTQSARILNCQTLSLTEQPLQPEGLVSQYRAFSGGAP